MQKLNIERGSLSVALVCMVLGFMLAVQFRSTQDFQSSLPYQRVEELTRRLEKAEAENDNLQQRLLDIQNASDEEQGRFISDNMKIALGQTAIEGSGVIVLLDDSAKTVKKDDPNLYLVHDEDMLRVVNELRAAGAEAISINGQRLMSTSEIRCAGPTISVNNVRSAPPFEIRAIGNSKDLAAAINMRGGVADTLKVWGITLEVTEAPNVLIPPYKAAAQQFQYASATDRQEGE